MIEGWFDDEGKLHFEITLIAANGEEFIDDAILDTGSTEWLVINSQDLQGLAWSVVERGRPMQTAQGESLFDIYLGKVLLDGSEIEILVVAGSELEEKLLGVPWLQTRRLVADFPLGLLTLG